MRYFPINLDIRGKPAIIVGGGTVASRKALRLLDAGAMLTVIAPELSPPLRQLSDSGRLTHLARNYNRGDLAGAFLVFAATSDSTVNRQVAEEATTLGILANRADTRQAGDFTTPAIVQRGELLITVSTGGTCPALAEQISSELAAQFGEEYGETARLLAAIREKLLTEKVKNAYNKSVFSELLRHNLPQLLKNSQTEETDHLLRELFGRGFTLEALRSGEKDHS